MNKNTTAPANNNRLFLIEFYTNEPNGRGGFKKNADWDINFAWVYSSHSTKAVDKLHKAQGDRYNSCITISEQGEITKLSGDFRVSTTDANLFILY